VSLPEISARIRRLQGEWSYKGAYQLCEEFLLACMQEGLSDDHIVILAPAPQRRRAAGPERSEGAPAPADPKVGGSEVSRGQGR